MSATHRTDPATARHRIANLLHGYTAIADRKDVPAGVELLHDACVVFPHAAFGGHPRADLTGRRTVDGAAELFGELWGAPVGHRHDVTNLVVEPDAPGLWRATAHYTRWLLNGAPVLTALGEYELLVREQDWRVELLVVTRTWSA